MPDSALFDSSFEKLLAELNALTADLETGEHDWPRRQFDLFAAAGVLGWVIPEEFGGAAIATRDLTDGYARLGAACLTTTFILTQRNGACQRIAGADNESLKAELLPPLGRGEAFATVGVSHLTTSRQHLKQPAVRVEQRGGQWVFDGTVPWVTGANQADYIVTGGTCEDGRQVLAAVPTNLEGVSTIDPPKLLALNETQTGSVELQNVALDDRWLLDGPVEDVMKRGTGGGAGSLTTSALAIGAARGTLNRLSGETENRPDLLETYQPLDEECRRLYDDLLAANSPDTLDPRLTTVSIRSRANSLVIRAAHAYLTASKGAGFVAGHPAGRAVREATFFLVWSCPQPVQSAAMREFACVLE